MSDSPLNAERIEVGDYFAWQERAFAERWSDGLPVAPPVPERVEEMIAAGGRDPGEVLGMMPPSHAPVTVEAVAINAVMAGCLPLYFPVVVAAVEAALQPPFNLHGVQTTTHMSEPLIIVSGPAVERLGINTGLSLFGHGSRANGTIGRALRLVLWNVGRSYPGEPDMSTYAHPGQWSFCIGEIWGDANPWTPIHVERGFAPEESVVTLFACEAPHSIHLRTEQNPEQILHGIASALRDTGPNIGGERLIVISPLNARALARAGYGKADVRAFLWDETKQTAGERQADRWFMLPDESSQLPADQVVASFADSPEGIHLMCAGGEGRFAVHCPGWGQLGGFAVSQAFTLPA